MYRVQLAAACFTAASQAIDLHQAAAKTNSRPTLLNAAQIGVKQEDAAADSTSDGCCCHALPCVPTCSNMCDEDQDHDEPVDAEEVNDALYEEVQKLGDDVGDDIDTIMDDVEEFVNNNVPEPEEAQELITEVIEPDVID